MSHSATAGEARCGVPFRVVALQTAATALAAAVAVAWGADAAVSVLLGGAVAVVPNACFAWTLRGGGGVADGAEAAGAAAGVLLRWVGKMALTVGLLVLALRFLTVAYAAFVVGLAVAVLAPLGAPLVIGKLGDER